MIPWTEAEPGRIGKGGLWGRAWFSVSALLPKLDTRPRCRELRNGGGVIPVMRRGQILTFSVYEEVQ